MLGSFAKKYDRSLIVVLVAMITIFTIWLKIGTVVDDVIARSSVVQEIKQKQTIYSVTDNIILEQLDDLKKDIKDIKKMLWQGRR